MKVLIIGSGGREHVLAWKIASSPEVEKVYCAPGNAGMREVAQCVPITAEDINLLADFATEKNIDLTIVGPEGPLAGGIVDTFEMLGLKVFGPSKAAAALESSKSFAKSLMRKYNIPCAGGRSFSRPDKALRYMGTINSPFVVKADGLAAGKGVIICNTPKEGKKALSAMLSKGSFGDAGKTVVIEEFLTGEEASFIAFTDGINVLPLPSSQDHKTIYDDDKGPNTGGMGAYSPAPVVDSVMHKKIMDHVMLPVVRAMAAEGRPYKGVLYAGLMIDGDRVSVVEFNCRFGDPEAQPLLFRTKSDIVPVMLACIEGGLNQYSLDIDKRPAVCIVMASKGYPGSYKKGLSIKGLDRVARMKDIYAFHSGTTEKNGKIVTNGGRVLGVTAMGDSINSAISRAYKAVEKISWTGEYHRTDIGHKALIRQDIKPAVGIVMGSDSDFPIMAETAEMLKKFRIPYEITIASAHRTPRRAVEFAESAEGKGIKVIIAGAGHAAHLAGALAAHTILPVIGVPIDSSPLIGMDAILSTVQMPPGIPVGTMAVGKPGAKNAAIFAAQILAANNPEILEALREFKAGMAAEVEKKAELLSS